MVTMPSRAAVTCGVDIGSTNCKVVALDRGGRVVARASRPTPRHPIDLSIDAVLLFVAIENMIIEACGSEYTVHAVAVAGVGEDGILIDESGEPLGRALAWFDPRRSRLFHDLEPLLLPAPGLGVSTDASRTIVGWLWASNQPGHDRASSWVALADYAAARWSSMAFMSDTLAARTSAWVPETRTWIPDRVAATLHDQALLPEVIPTGDIVGPLRSAHLEHAHVLADGAVVVAGGHDHPIGGWAVHLLHPGAILDSMGTAEVIVAQSAKPYRSDQGHPRVDVAPGIRSEGSTLLRVEELARNYAWASQDPAVADALKNIIDGTTTPDEFLNSEEFYPGVQGGGRPRYALTAPRSPLSRASAVVGALARLGGNAIDAVVGNIPATTRVYAAGGWARSPGWMEVKKSVGGHDITILGESEVTAVGAALLAATALQWPVSPGTALKTERSHP